MLRHYLRTIWRNMRSLDTFINITGLSVGFAFFIVIFIWVSYERSFDDFHVNAESIYRIIQKKSDADSLTSQVALTPGPLAEHLQSTQTAVEKVTRASLVEFCIRTDINCLYKKGIAVDSSFLDVFTFPLIKGSASAFGNEPNQIIITQRLAEIFFGKEDPLGKTFIIGPFNLLILAVINNPTENTHFYDFDFLIPMQFMSGNGLLNTDDWHFSSLHTYVKLNAGSDAALFEKSISKTLLEKQEDGNSLLALQPLQQIHLRSTALNNDVPGRGNITYVIIFSWVGTLVLLIACLTYANLTTARLFKRNRATAVRKVLGSGTSQIILYSIVETFLYAFMALLMALVLVWLVLPHFNALTSLNLALHFTPENCFYLFAMLAITTMLSGFYPALLLTRQQAVASLKGQSSSDGALSIRRVLVVTQFSLAIGLVSATLIIQDQLNFINRKALGYDKEQIVSFTALRKFLPQFESLRSELKALKQVKAVTGHNHPIVFTDENTSDVEWSGKNETDHTFFHKLIVDHEFIDVYNLSVKSGRAFTLPAVSDTASIMLNESAAAIMNMVAAEEQEIVVQDRKYRLIGILKDFHFKSVHKTIEPLIMYTYPAVINNVSVKLTNGGQEAVAAVESVFKKYAPERPFDYHFIDEDVANLYKTEQRTDVVFSYLGGFALFISCLGLLGIVRFMTEQRAKEMAVRKVLGASAFSITGILSAEYVKILLVAFLLSSVVVYGAMQQWLQAFAYRTDISIASFLVSLSFALLTAMLTVGIVILKSANTNPVVSLRNE
jgi:putative ABC transport system permease protein